MGTALGLNIKEIKVVMYRYKDTLNTSTIDHYALTVSEWSKDNTVSFCLRDMIRRFRDCLGR